MTDIGPMQSYISIPCELDFKNTPNEFFACHDRRLKENRKLWRNRLKISKISC